MPPRGAQTLPGFHPFANHIRCETYPLVKPIPGSSRESAAGRQSTPLWRLCFPFGRAMPP
ncbi:MAG: hypothetical protein LBK61_09605 [Spirochaetaceae bacterium]|nr:hypothetical protein [Spirochaetaceae bacterium]